MKLKFKRFFAGIMAGTMVVAMGVPTLPTIADDLEYNGYLCFQTPSYSFRNACDDSSYGINGTYNTDDVDYSVIHAWDGSDLVSAAGTFTDAVITGDGTYTVSVSGLNWDDDEFGTSDCYNLIFLSTDIPVDAFNYGLTITIDEFTVGGETVELDDDMIFTNWEDVLYDDELTTGLQISIQNIWADNKTIGSYDITASEMSITFTVSGLDYYASQTTDIARENCGDNLTWMLDDEGVLSITGTGDMYEYASSSDMPWYEYNEDITSVVINEGLTSISDFAFYGCKNINNVVLPDSLTSIGNRAFAYCTSLEEVELPDSITAIGVYAFAGCKNLTNIFIPVGVESIGDYAFLDCQSLQSIDVDENNAYYSSQDGVLFNKDMTTLIRYPAGKEGSYDIPDGVVVIEEFAFGVCEDLTAVTFPDTLTTIDLYAFTTCTSLTEVELPNSLTSMYEGVFFKCTALESIVIPDSVTQLSMCNFMYCDNLKKVTLSENLTTIYGYTFCGCTSLESIEIPENVTSIDEEAFSNCSSMEVVIMYDGIEKIGMSAFAHCDAITDVYYSGSEEEWNEISIFPSGNYCLTAANIHFNSYYYKNGDINKDSKIDYLDAMAALRYDAELIDLSNAQTTIGDVNGDGSVNSLDAILILRYDAGLIDSFE